MKIGNNHPGGPVGPLDPKRGSGEAKPAGEPFRGTQADAPHATQGPLSLPANATRADLDDPAKYEKLIRSAVTQTLDASPLGAQLPAGARATLETQLAGDPAMRDLLGRWLEGTLR